MNDSDLVSLADEAAGEIFDKPDFEPCRDKIFTRKEFQLLCRESILTAMLALNIYFIAGLKIGVIGILWSSVIVNGFQMVVFCG